MLEQRYRLRKHKEFKKAYIAGKKIYGRFVIVFFVPNRRDNNRYGLVTSKKVGKAVIRNKLKRQLREIIREYDGELSKGYDVVLVMRPSGREADFYQLKRDVAGVFNKAKLFL